jgi:transposase
MRRRITARGVHPLLLAAYHFESLYLYGAVGPLTGESFFLELPTLNTQGFQLFLDHFAATDAASSHLLLLDNGAFHKARALRLPPNLGLLFFPPYAPELNPIERLWRDLKDWLAHSQPASLDALSELLCAPQTVLACYAPLSHRLSLSALSYSSSECPMIKEKSYNALISPSVRAGTPSGSISVPARILIGAKSPPRL